jgi:hypothetical protein
VQRCPRLFLKPARRIITTVVVLVPSAAALSNDPAEQALLIAAKLADEKSVPGLPAAEALIKITIGGKIPTELGRLKEVPKNLEPHLRTIIQSAKNDPAVEQVITHLAAVLASKR